MGRAGGSRFIGNKCFTAEKINTWWDTYYRALLFGLFLFVWHQKSHNLIVYSGTFCLQNVEQIPVPDKQIPVPDQIKTIQAIEPGNRCPHMC